MSCVFLIILFNDKRNYKSFISGLPHIDTGCGTKSIDERESPGCLFEQRDSYCCSAI